MIQNNWFRRLVEAKLSWRGAKFASISCLVLGCQSPDLTEGEEIAEVQQAVVSAFNVSFTVPAAADINGIVLVGDSNVTVSDRVQLEGTTHSTTSTIALGNEIKVRSLSAKGNVTIGERGTVTGNVVSGGTVTRPSSTTVTGTVQSGANLGTPRAISWTYQADSASLGSVIVGNQVVRDLAPGTYSNLHLQSGGQLTLHGGVYRFTDVTIEATTKLLVDNRSAPVQVYLSGNFTYRGSVLSASVGIPQLVVAKTTAGNVTIEAPFTGLLVAPQSEIRIQAARPYGHRAQFIGKTVSVEPDTIIKNYPFNWLDLVPSAAPTVPANTPVHSMPRAAADIPVGVDSDGQGTKTSSSNPGKTITFTLPQTYPTTGGVIANGTVTFKFVTPAGVTVTCTYKGGSATATPSTETELNKGRLLNFQSCSDGLVVGSVRQGTRFDLTVTPAPNYGVTVNSPVVSDKSCSEEMQLLSPVETQQMRQGFSWSGASDVAATNADGNQALYYGWIYIRNKLDAVNLKKLYIHVLSRPLFNEELDKFAGKCGTFVNPGDGSGAFVPVVIPGATYNKIRAALTSSAISSDKVIFDAVILRSPPAAARNANNSIRLDVLANSGFRYLHYEPRPLLATQDIQLDTAGVSKTLVGAIEWVATAAKNAAELATNALGALDALLRGKVNQRLFMHAWNNDNGFPSNSVMVRAWGPLAGRELAAAGLQVSILQKFLDLPLPSTSMGHTNAVGEVSIDAVDGADMRGSGLCMELKNDGAIVTDFLIATELCDLRAFNDMTGSIENFQLRDLGKVSPLHIKIAQTRVLGMYEADDSYRYSRDVLGFRPKRARILSGYWADTFTKHKEGNGRLYAGCLNFPNTLTDAGITAGALAGLVVTPLVGTAVTVFKQIVMNSDITMPMYSYLRRSRQVMSHEYGHYILCAMMDAANSAAVDHLIWNTIAQGDDRRVPLRYVNEAFADFITGQVAGGADYNWLVSAERSEGGDYCTPSTTPCFDRNQRASATLPEGAESIGRIATLIHDAFDGGNAKFQNLPGNADAWEGALGSLVHRATTYGSTDSALENVVLPSSGVREFASSLASGLGNFGTGATVNDAKIYRAVNDAMNKSSVNWCSRCRVLALHSPTNLVATDTIASAFQHCVGDSLIRGALNQAAPEASGRIAVATCSACPAGQTSDANGLCVNCTKNVVGNQCVDCTADVLRDGSTLALAGEILTPTSPAGDTCPSVFTVELRNPQLVFPRGAGTLVATAQPATLNAAQCNRPYELALATNNSAGFVTSQVITGTGVYAACTAPCVTACNGLPSRSYSSSQVTSGIALRFSIPAGDATKRLALSIPPAPPR